MPTTPRRRHRPIVGLALVLAAAAVVAVVLLGRGVGTSAGTADAGSTAPTATTPLAVATTAPAALSSAGASRTAPPTLPGSGASTTASRTSVAAPVSPTSVANDPTYSAPAGAAEVSITSSGWDASTPGITVTGFVAGVLEDGGTCTLTLTRAGATATATSTAGADATTTVCDVLSVPAGQLTSGTWQGTVSYRSATTSGTSSSFEVTVP